MRAILLGPPGVGKGTQAARIVERFQVPHIATGDLLRAEARGGTPLGAEARTYMDAGKLVPDAVVIDMFRERLNRSDARFGFLLDGFPRTVVQAEALDAMLAATGRPLDRVIGLSAPDEIIVERLAWRAVCPRCGRPGSVVGDDPGICDSCGTPRLVRDDDKPEVVRERLKVYRAQTAPVIEYYRSRGLLAEIDGSGAPGQTEAAIAKALDAAAA